MGSRELLLVLLCLCFHGNLRHKEPFCIIYSEVMHKLSQQSRRHTHTHTHTHKSVLGRLCSILTKWGNVADAVTLIHLKNWPGASDLQVLQSNMYMYNL